jgi:serine/threonine protein kinase
MKAYGKIENDKVYFFKENSILNDNEDASFFIILPFFQDSLRSKISAWKRGANYSWEQRKEECLRIFDNLSKSVNTYYKLSWIHGDLKPDNICFNGNDIIIIDWATAYQWDKQQNRAFTLDGTSSNLPIGICSPPYVLATQERHLDKDFYSLKIILWEMFELPHFSKTQNLAKKNQSPCFSEKTLESILNDISNRLEKTINKQELLEIQEKIKNINVEEEQVQSKRAGIASTVKLESIPAEAYEKLANKPVELKQTPTIYAVKSGGSIPTSWSQELWKSCWNEEFVDFTEDDWCTLSLQEQRKLAGEYQKWYGEKYNKGQYEKTYSIKRGTASTKIEMLLIPPGKYWQGSPETESGRLSK